MSDEKNRKRRIVDDSLRNLDLQNIYSYDALTGFFARKINRKWCKLNSDGAVGYVNPDGYRVINYKGKPLKAHRIAWFLHYGKWPSEEIDHINGFRDDNRICNLRLAGRSNNSANSKPHKDGRWGVKGINYHKNRAKKFQARIFVRGKQISLGYYYTLEDAALAYANAAKKYFGEFARV